MSELTTGSRRSEGEVILTSAESTMAARPPAHRLALPPRSTRCAGANHHHLLLLLTTYYLQHANYDCIIIVALANLPRCECSLVVGILTAYTSGEGINETSIGCYSPFARDPSTYSISENSISHGETRIERGEWIPHVLINGSMASLCFQTQMTA